MTSRRLYVGRLPADVQRTDFDDLFGKYGRLTDVRIMGQFGFVEFDSGRDADDAVRAMNGYDFKGERLLVEFAKEPRRRDPYSGPGGGYGAPAPARSLRRGQHRLLVTNLPRETSWQDLKDFGRSAGPVTFADVSRDRPGEGVIEYSSREDADTAVKTLDRTEIRGSVVRVEEDRSGGYDDRGGGREDRYGGGRDYDRGGYGGDRDRDYRRDDRDYRGGGSGGYYGGGRGDDRDYRGGGGDRDRDYGRRDDRGGDRYDRGGGDRDRDYGSRRDDDRDRAPRDDAPPANGDGPVGNGDGPAYD